MEIKLDSMCEKFRSAFAFFNTNLTEPEHGIIGCMELANVPRKFGEPLKCYLR